MSSSNCIRKHEAPAIRNWSDEYDNISHTPPNALKYFTYIWPNQAQTFRDTYQGKIELDIPYGIKERNKMDIFSPTTTSEELKGIFIFVHGGYWFKCSKSMFSHLAEGPLRNGYKVVIPSYTLCPETTIPEITKEVSDVVDAACGPSSRTNHGGDVPIVLCGHSAGGHLVTRQICSDISKSIALHQRIKCVISISGVHDLRPITRIVQNETIQLTEEDANKESPVLLEPSSTAHDIPVICMVGSKELPEFIRQNDLLPMVWRGMGVPTTTIHVEGKHHFDIIDDLINPNGVVCQYL